MDPIRRRKPIDRPERSLPIKKEEKEKLGVRELLTKLVDEKENKEKRTTTKKKKKKWRFPTKWKMQAKKSSKHRDAVLVFYLNVKGELEQPLVVPIYSGNMIIIRNKVYEVDPRAFWTIKIGFKTYKLLIIKEIDRRPVSNLDWDDIRRRGDATDSDEFLIKAALKAQITTTARQVSKGIIYFILAAVVIGGIVLFVMSGK